jgi:hypothetical protein
VVDKSKKQGLTVAATLDYLKRAESELKRVEIGKKKACNTELATLQKRNYSDCATLVSISVDGFSATHCASSVVTEHAMQFDALQGNAARC